jgi:hypothetical protein
MYYVGSVLLVPYILETLTVGFGFRMMVAGDWTVTFHFMFMVLVICASILLSLFPVSASIILRSRALWIDLDNQLVA